MLITFSVMGAVCPAVPPPLLGEVAIESPLLPQSAACPELVLSILDFSHADSFLLVQSHVQSGFSTATVGTGLDCTLLALDFAHSGSMPLPHGLGCPGSVMLPLSFAHPEPSVFLRAFYHLGFILPASGLFCPSSSILLLDFIHFGLLVVLRSPS